MTIRVLSLTLVAVLLGTIDAAERPNVVLLLSDDLGYRDIGSYGGPVKTPTLDALAARGTRFTDFYATPVCSSTRGTIESGQNSARTGITDFLPGHWRPYEKQIVPPMPQELDHSITTPGEARVRLG